MAASKEYGTPSKVSEDGLVTYADGKTAYVASLKRSDLMALASAMGKSQGRKVSLGMSNAELLEMVRDIGTWQLEEGAKHMDEKTPVEVTCACGHTYVYKVKEGPKRAATVKWLETQDCKPCQRKNGGSKQNSSSSGQSEAKQEQKESKPQGQELPKTGNTQAMPDLDKLADLVVQKVMERMNPVELPKVAHELLPDIVKMLQATEPKPLNVYLSGGPGVSKSFMAAQAAEVLGLAVHERPCFDQMSDVDLFGYKDAHGTYHRTAFREAWEHGGVFILDEMDKGNANTLASLNLALTTPRCVFPDGTVARHKDFRCVATANTNGNGPTAGHLGSNEIDKATMDRFVKVYVPIDENLEELITVGINDQDGGRILRAVRAIRAECEERMLDLVVSPRAPQNIAQLMRAGFSLETSLKRTCLFGLDEITQASLLEIGLRAGA